MKKLKLMDEVVALPESELEKYILRRAAEICEATQGDSWDDPEELTLIAAEMAHAIVRVDRIKRSESTPPQFNQPEYGRDRGAEGR